MGRAEEAGCWQGPQHTGKHRNGADEEERQVCRPRLGDDQDAPEAGHESREEGDVREGGVGQGEAREDCREGLPSEGAKGRVLTARHLWMATSERGAARTA